MLLLEVARQIPEEDLGSVRMIRLRPVGEDDPVAPILSAV